MRENRVVVVVSYVTLHPLEKPEKQNGDPRSPQCVGCAQLQVRVFRSFSAFWRNPFYELVGVADIAGFAVNTVGEVDLQFLFALVGRIIDHVYTCAGQKRSHGFPYSSVHLVTQ